MALNRASAAQVALILRLTLTLEPRTNLTQRRSIEAAWRRSTREAANGEIQRLNGILGFTPEISGPSDPQLGLISRLEREIYGAHGPRTTPEDVPTHKAANDRIQALLATKRARLNRQGSEGTNGASD
jgi:hypothetical protein